MNATSDELLSVLEQKRFTSVDLVKLSSCLIIDTVRPIDQGQQAYFGRTK